MANKRFVNIGSLTLLLAWLVAVNAQAAITVTRGEMAQKTRWVQQNLLTPGNPPPFSFIYDGQASSALLPSWERTETDTDLGTNGTQHVLMWTDARTGLQIKCVAIEYKDYPMVEWTVYLKDIGTNSTPILEDIQGLDTRFSRGNGPEFVLNGNQGDSAAPDSYEPYQLTLGPSSVNTFSPSSGKSCDTTGWPYYNLQMPGGGMILAIGWPGQWASSFTRDAGFDLRIQAGQQLTHLILNPGEEIRTPLIGLFFWRGTNVVRAQNLWRHWYLAHEIPRVNGQPPSTIIAVAGDSTNDVNRYLQAGVKPDIMWRDADTEPYTWYPVAPYADTTADWFYTGTWEVDTNSYPHGFGPISSAIHALGVKFLLWFEPERVGNPNSWLATNHPEWLLPLPGAKSTGFDGPILNEGNPIAFNWLTNHIEGMIQANGIDWYREDMNSGRLVQAWRKNDAPDRQGITENFYVQGHLAYWDALLAMNPALRIDCCGSGGRRNDLEAMQRSVPLDRSDFNATTTLAAADGEQCQTYGLSSWLPFQGTGCGCWAPYYFRSSYMASFAMGFSPVDTAAQLQAVAELKKIAPIMLNGDYYPLTPYSLTNTVWMAWQFDRPARGDGVVQAFRRAACTEPAQTFRLCGLDPSAQYTVTNFDAQDSVIISGRELMKKGLAVEIKDQPGAAVIAYQRVQ